MRSGGATTKLCLAEIHKLLICENLNLNYRSDYFYIVLARLNTRDIQRIYIYIDDPSKAHTCVVPVYRRAMQKFVSLLQAHQMRGSNII